MTYPGRIPESSFVMDAGDVHVVAQIDESVLNLFGAELQDRTAVLAAGSNAAPARLAEKCGSDATIPVPRLTLADTAIVYSAHITRYGSIAATRIARRGVTSTVHVPFFDPGQLAHVDASEGSYRRVETGTLIDELEVPIHTYESWRGVLHRRGVPMALADVSADGDLMPATQRQALDHVASVTGAARDGAALSRGVASGSIDPEEVNAALVD